VIDRRALRTPVNHPFSLYVLADLSVCYQPTVLPCDSIARPSTFIDEAVNGNRELNFTDKIAGRKCSQCHRAHLTAYHRGPQWNAVDVQTNNGVTRRRVLRGYDESVLAMRV